MCCAVTSDSVLVFLPTTVLLSIQLCVCNCNTFYECASLEKERDDEQESLMLRSGEYFEIKTSGCVH